MGEPDASAGRREGLREVIADEVAEEARGSGKIQSAGESSKGFGTV
jgi:hypothetical protein